MIPFFRRSFVASNATKTLAFAGAAGALFSVASISNVAVAKSAISSTRSAAGAVSLSFDVSANLMALQHGKASDMPAQTFEAHVAVKGRNARVETEMGDRPVVYLLTPTHLTKLLPGSKAGVRWAVPRRVKLPGAGNSGIAASLQDLMRDPSALRATLQKNGARRVGAANLNGTPVDVYTAPSFLGGKQKLTAWLRRGDALPLRVQLVGPTLSSTLSWRNYNRAALPDTLFQAPRGYNVRDSSGQPSF